jgi:hypothetical protein
MDDPDVLRGLDSQDVRDEKRTPKQWTEYLAMESNPVTLDEYVAGCLSRLLGAQIAAAQAAEHTEGMVGALDQFAAALAERSGIPYATSGTVRAALDRERKEQRRLAGRTEDNHR